MESRIWREKIMLVYHVSHLDEGSLAKDMLYEQVANNWPGLASEVKDLCKSMNLEDPMTTEKSRKAFNNIVKEGCKWKDEARMKEEMQKMKEKKMRTMVNGNLDMKEYVKKGTLYSARKTWEVRSQLPRRCQIQGLQLDVPSLQHESQRGPRASDHVRRI